MNEQWRRRQWTFRVRFGDGAGPAAKKRLDRQFGSRYLTDGSSRYGADCGLFRRVLTILVVLAVWPVVAGKVGAWAPVDVVLAGAGLAAVGSVLDGRRNDEGIAETAERIVVTVAPWLYLYALVRGGQG